MPNKSIKPAHVVKDDGEAFSITGPHFAQPVILVPYQIKQGDGSPKKSEAKVMAKEIAKFLSEPYFVEAFNVCARSAHATAKSKGWWDFENAMVAKITEWDLIERFISAQDGKVMALITSEVSEALEALRHGNPPDDKIPDFSGVEAELADVIIRIMDVSQRRGWRVAEAVIEKMGHNAIRSAMHGGKKF
jgi:hypothetical protein